MKVVTKKRLDLSLILACYNEEPIFVGSIEWIIKTLERSGYSYEIILIDDKSNDRTSSLIKKLSKENKCCKSIFHKINQGRGKTIADGFGIASGEVVGYIDFDCEVSPVYIPDIVDIILHGKVDGIVGRRIYRSGFFSILREVLSIGYRKLSNFLFMTQGIDTESGYKFFRRSKILPILDYCKDSRWFWDTEIIVFSLLEGLVIKEYPVLFIRRADKISSVNILRDTIAYLGNIINLKRRLKKKRHLFTNRNIQRMSSK